MGGGGGISGGRGGRGGEVGAGSGAGAGAGDGGAIVIIGLIIGCGTYVLAFANAIRLSARLRHTTVSTTSRPMTATTGGIVAAATTPPDVGLPLEFEELIVRSEGKIDRMCHRHSRGGH